MQFTCWTWYCSIDEVTVVYIFVGDGAGTFHTQHSSCCMQNRAEKTNLVPSTGSAIGNLHASNLMLCMSM